MTHMAAVSIVAMAARISRVRAISGKNFSGCQLYSWVSPCHHSISENYVASWCFPDFQQSPQNWRSIYAKVGQPNASTVRLPLTWSVRGNQPSRLFRRWMKVAMSWRFTVSMPRNTGPRCWDSRWRCRSCRAIGFPASAACSCSHRRTPCPGCSDPCWPWRQDA